MRTRLTEGEMRAATRALTHKPRWASENELREAVLADCHESFKIVFGKPCTDYFLERTRAAFQRAVAEDQDARDLLGRLPVRRHRAERVLRKHGVDPDRPLVVLREDGTVGFACVTPLLRALHAAVQEKPKEKCIDISYVELREAEQMPALRNLREFVVQVFHVLPLKVEAPEWRFGPPDTQRMRVLSDHELAVVSLLLNPKKIRTTKPMFDRTEAQIIDEERGMIAPVRERLAHPFADECTTIGFAELPEF